MPNIVIYDWKKDALIIPFPTLGLFEDDLTDITAYGITHGGYLASEGVSFRKSPFILGTMNSQRVAGVSSLSDPPVASIPMEDTDDMDDPLSPQNIDLEQPIENLTSYGTVQQFGAQYTLIENSDSDSGISTEIVVHLGAYAVSFLYQFQVGDGLSDYDEIYVYFTDPTRADTDSDGVPDGMEVAAGTDPNSADSALRIHEIAPLANGDVRLVFPGADGRTYRDRGSVTPYGKTNWTIQSGVRATNGAASVIDPGRRNAFQRFLYWAEVDGID